MTIGTGIHTYNFVPNEVSDNLENARQKYHEMELVGSQIQALSGQLLTQEEGSQAFNMVVDASVAFDEAADKLK